MFFQFNFKETPEDDQLNEESEVRGLFEPIESHAELEGVYSVFMVRIIC